MILQLFGVYVIPDVDQDRCVSIVPSETRSTVSKSPPCLFPGF